MSKACASACAALALLAGCAPQALRRPGLKDIRPLPKFFLQELVTRRQAAGLSLAVYDTGSVTVKGDLLSELKSPRSRVKLSLPAFLLRHPEQGLILFDAGLPPQGAGGPNEFGAAYVPSPKGDLLAQLGRSGVKPEAVRWVVLSHLHWDHTGRLDAYPNAVVIVDRREWDAQAEKTRLGPLPGEFDPAAMEPKLRLRLLDLSSAPPYGVFDHGLDLFQDGSVYLLDLSGHSPGSLGLWANLDSGPVLLAGDASWVLDNHQDLALPEARAVHDAAQYWRKLNMMNRMAREVPQLVIFPGHDLMPLRLQPKTDIRPAP
jgi:glyoxylase-like metal-dependent hydrolase (beta-lactamase superfamily II)